MLPAIQTRQETSAASFSDERKRLAEPGAAQVMRHLTHELRQPLSAMESLAYYLDIILPEGETRPRQQLEKIQRMIEQMSSIMDDASTFVRASEPQPAAVLLDELVTTAVVERMRGRKLNLHLDFDEQPCRVWLDQRQAERLIHNLWQALRRAAHPESMVRVRTRRAGETVEISFACDSATVSADQFRSLFHLGSPGAASGAAFALPAVAATVHDARGAFQVYDDLGWLTVSVCLPCAESSRQNAAA